MTSGFDAADRPRHLRRREGYRQKSSLLIRRQRGAGANDPEQIFDNLQISALYLATAALWPLLIVILALIYFGVLPGGIWDL
jgi:hypothetical protein